ncbi:MAG TPA: DUF192 domain-containing protein [Dehalococcoidia bacterium]|nr:DUF192 domain-containing protein [Dehalococcoidia bacterium]
MQFVNSTRDTALATAGWQAGNPWTRMVGLLGRAGLAPGEGLHISPCKSIHTLFMRFPIDVLYLDRARRVVKAVPAMRPWRYSWGSRGSYSVLELPAGTIEATGTAAGDQITLGETRDQVPSDAGEAGEAEG